MDLIKKHAQSLYKKIRNRFNNISMLDENGRDTLDDREAKIFNMLFSKDDPESMVTLDILSPHKLKIIFSRNMVKKFNDYDKQQWFEFLGELRRFTVKAKLDHDLIDLEKPGLSRRDISAMIKSNKIEESRFSRLSGSKRTSYQLLEKHKIKVLHGKIINDDIHGSRSRNIKALFIENNLGERYRFPFLNLSGVRAMARHMEEGGHWSDRLGHQILEMTNNLCTIKSFVREVKRQKLVNENMLPVLQQLREKQMSYKRDLYLLSGSKGYHSYKQNLSETYVEPVESIAGHFNAVNPAIEKYLPSIEKILGEKQTNTLVDQVVAEQVNWIKDSSKLVFEADPAVTGTSTLDPKAASAQQDLVPPKELLAILKPPPSIPGRKVKVTPQMLISVGITSPAAVWNKMPTNQKAKLIAAAKLGKIPMPTVVYYKETKQYAADDADKEILIMLTAFYKNVEVWVINPEYSGKLLGSWKSKYRSFMSGYATGQGITNRVLGFGQSLGVKE